MAADREASLLTLVSAVANAVTVNLQTPAQTHVGESIANHNSS